MTPGAGSIQALINSGNSLISERFQRVLLVLISLGLILGMIEFPALINVLDYRAVLGNNFAWWPINNVKDPELVHIRRPYAHFSGTTLGGGITGGFVIPKENRTLYHWDDRYDRNGFRNETDLKQADIAVIGDSIVEGVTVDSHELMTSLLGRSEGKVVANLGQSMYGPQEELIVLRRYALPLHPRVVFWIFSDSTDLDDAYYYDRNKNTPDDWLHAFWARSFTRISYALLFHGRKRPGAVRSGIFEGHGEKPVTVYFPYASHDLTRRHLNSIKRTADILAEAKKLSAAQGTRLIFVFSPDKFRVLRNFCTFPKESECPTWKINDAPERLERAVKQSAPGVEYMDLTPELVRAAQSGVMPYYPDDDHWSPVGHRIAAEAIHRYLASSDER
jgi:hypothetical protein